MLFCLIMPILVNFHINYGTVTEYIAHSQYEVWLDLTRIVFSYFVPAD